jgi:hypothetical protein
LRCKQVESVPIPPGDQPTAAERKGLAACDAEVLYYGYGSQPDFVAARKCAYAQLDSRAEPVFGGSGMLMMLYANGRGVPRNLELALKFACKSDGAPFEIESAVTALWDARQGSALKGVVDLCEFTSSGYRAGFCAARDERFAALARDARKAKAVAQLPAAEVAALERTAKSFFEARWRNEIDMSGTMRGALAVDEEARLAEEYTGMLEHLVDPAFRPSAAATQAELDAAFARLLGCKDLGGELGKLMGFSRQGFLATQKQWSAYRDAWLALVRKARPSDVSAWRGWLMAERAHMLASVPLCQ